MTHGGPARGDIRLGDVVNGDRLTEMTLTLYDPPEVGGSIASPTARETISVSNADPAQKSVSNSSEAVSALPVASEIHFACQSGE